VGGIPEVVESGRSGLLVPFGDTTAVARSIESLLADSTHRAALGAAAKSRAAELFSADRIVAQYVSYYRKMLKGGAA
jgi:glycosyltransferase involved in cell wall biosynthesis